MPHDIYTKLPIATRSEEHIVPRSLGGKLSSFNLIDKTTNDRFGHGIDAALERALRDIRVILDARNADGDPPRALNHVRGDDGKQYRVESGGRIRPAPQMTKFEVSEREIHIEATVSDERELRQMVRKKFAGKDDQLAAFIEKAMREGTRRTTAPPRMDFSLPLWDEEPYRATAKIAFNLLAHRDPDLALDPAFDAIRSFVLDGTRLPVWPVQATHPPVGPSLSELDHFVRVEVQTDGEVVAWVSYFGHFGLVIRLGSTPEAVPWATTYRIDQLNRLDRHNAEDDLAIAMPSFQEAAERSYEEFDAFARKQGATLFQNALAQQRSSLINRIVRTHLNELGRGASSEGPLSVEAWERVIGPLITNLFTELAPQHLEGAEAAAMQAHLRRLLMSLVTPSSDDPGQSGES